MGWGTPGGDGSEWRVIIDSCDRVIPLVLFPNLHGDGQQWAPSL